MRLSAFRARVASFYENHPNGAPLLLGVGLYGVTDVAANRLEHLFMHDKPWNPCRTLGVMSAAPVCTGCLVQAYRLADRLFDVTSGLQDRRTMGATAVARNTPQEQLLHGMNTNKHVTAPPAASTSATDAAAGSSTSSRRVRSSAKSVDFRVLGKKVLFMQLAWTPLSIWLFVTCSTTAHLTWEVIWERFLWPKYLALFPTSSAGRAALRNAVTPAARTPACLQKVHATSGFGVEERGVDQEDGEEDVDGKRTSGHIPRGAPVDDDPYDHVGLQLQPQVATFMNARELSRLEADLAKLFGAATPVCRARPSMSGETTSRSLAEGDDDEAALVRSRASAGEEVVVTVSVCAALAAAQNLEGGKSSRSTIHKTAVDASVDSHLAAQGHQISFAEAVRTVFWLSQFRFRENFWEIYLTSWWVWPISDFLNFTLIQRLFSPHFRATWDAGVGLFWNTYQCLVTFRTSSALAMP
ncbi:unnamed protein product [Amoebophrya sp. A120]|nr:unnamed protein product [Amoebophrya sp. A120]|eukprot:GSA120T00001077001.1